MPTQGGVVGAGSVSPGKLQDEKGPIGGQLMNECRRRQDETFGHRGHKTDPLCRCLKLLLKAEERLDLAGLTKLTGLLRAGDPRGEVAHAWHAKQAVRFLYDIPTQISPPLPRRARRRPAGQ